MKNLKVKDILAVTNGELIVGNVELECRSFSKDTREIKEGDCYIAIKGTNFDGNKFWEEALENGASSVIVENVNFTEQDKEKWKDKSIIKVRDTLEALYEIAKYKRSLYDIPVIAITGSVGKTSTKDIVSNVISKKYKTLKTIGNNNNNIGLPFTILRLQDEEVMVLEMGMNHLGEISLLSSIARPTICIITNVGTSHIGNLGSRENILKAKLEILEGAENPTIIINNDNDLLHKWYEENKKKMNIKTYGITEKSNLMAENIQLQEHSSKFTCKLNDENKTVIVPVGGEHFILNSLCAILAGESLKIPIEKIIEGIENFELTKKRMDITEVENGIKIINDAYNASYESMQATLKVLGTMNSRKIAVLGDMFELGDFSKELHEKVADEVCKNKIDILIGCGENTKYLIEKAKKIMNPENVYFLKDKEEIIGLLEKIVNPRDVILFKASNGMKFYELAERMIKAWKKEK